MKTVNILWAQTRLADGNSIFDSVRKNLENYNLFHIGEFKVINSKRQVDEEIRRGDYDVLIATDIIEGEPIGGGTVSSWREESGNKLQIILLLGDSKAAGTSLFNMWQRGFFDFIFQRDYGTGQRAAEMIASGRTAEEAAAYYQLEGNPKYKEYIESLSEKEQPKEDTQKEDPYPENEFMADVNSLFTDQNETDSVPMTASETDDYIEPELEVAGAYPDEEVYVQVQSVGKPTANEQKKTSIEKEEKMRQQRDILPENNLSDEGMEKYHAPVMTSNFHSPMQLSGRQYHLSESSIVPNEGYVVHVISNTALIVEIPGANFLDDSVYPEMPVNLILPNR